MHRWGAWLLPVAALVAAARPAAAEGPPASAPGGAGYVLTLDSRDSERQALSLSAAIRLRAQGLPGWDSATREVSLEMMSAAFRCPPRPDPACLDRIGDALKADRFMWGLVRRSSSRQVTAEVHLWERGHPDAVVAEAYGDHLVDPNDFVLRRLAGRIVDRLTGRPVAGVITVRAPAEAGTKPDPDVAIDGAPAGTLVQGQAVIEVRPGRHAIEVNAGTRSVGRQEMDVEPGVDRVVSFGGGGDAAVEGRSSRGSTRAIIGWGMIGLGAVAAVVGTVEALRFVSLRSENTDDHERLRADDFCDPSRPHGGTAAELSAACDRLHDASHARTIEIVSYGAGAVLLGGGAALLLTGPRREKAQIELTPFATAHTGGVRIHGTF